MKVTFDNTAMIPDTAELVVKEILPGTPGYEAVMAAMPTVEGPKLDLPTGGYPINAPMGVDTEDGYSGNYQLLLDISIMDGETEIQPQSEVTVSVELKELPEGLSAEALASELNVQHMKEVNDGLEADHVTPSRTEATESESVYTEFVTNSFSTYVFCYKFIYNLNDTPTNYYRSTLIHYGYMNGSTFVEFPADWCTNATGFGPELFSSEEWSGPNGRWKSLDNNMFIPAIFDFTDPATKTIYTYKSAHATITMQARDKETHEFAK